MIVWCFVHTHRHPQAALGVIMSVFGLVITAILHGNILSFLGAGLQYWVFQPVYLNMLQVYAFANTDDISWGTLVCVQKHATIHAQSHTHYTHAHFCTPPWCIVYPIVYSLYPIIHPIPIIPPYTHTIPQVPRIWKVQVVIWAAIKTWFTATYSVPAKAMKARRFGQP